MTTQCDQRLAKRRPRVLTFGLLVIAILAAQVVGTADRGSAAITDVPSAQQIPNAGVHALLTRGSWLYLGGDFTTLTDPSTHAVVARERLARVSVTTGKLDSTWHPSVDGDVRALAMSAGGLTLDLAGSFTHVNGSARAGLAAVSTTSSGIRAWNPKPNGAVRALLTVGSNVAIGGSFSRIGTAVHHNVAMVTQKTGTPIKSFVATTNHGLHALALSTTGTAMYLGGDFTTAGGLARPFIAKVSIKTGKPTTWKPAAACSSASNPASNPCYVLAIKVSGSRVFAGVAGPGGRVVAYDISSGKALWRDYLDGDVQALAVSGSTLYVGGHFGPDFSGFTTYTVGVVAQATGAVDPSFSITVQTTHPGVWAMQPLSSGLAVAGDITQISDSSVNYFTVFRSVPSES